MSAARRHAGNDLRVNLTPMIDVVFQLIIFFMVVAQINRHRAVELTPPMIETGAPSRGEPDEAPLVIHVVPLVTPPQYRLDDEVFADTPESLAALARRVGVELSRRAGAAVHVRADRLEAYERVRPAIEAARTGGASEVGLVTTKPGDS